MPSKTTVQYFCRHIFFPHLVSFKNIIRKSAVEFICLSNEKDASYNYRVNFFVNAWHPLRADILHAECDVE